MMNIYFESVSDFFAMGGHGFYVWTCYLVVFVCFVIQTFRLVTGLTSAKKKLKRYYERQDNLVNNEPIMRGDK
jgi:heme exporter protein D